MSSITCSVRGCYNTWTKRREYLKQICFEHHLERSECCGAAYNLHRPPKEEEHLRLWLKALNLKRPPKSPYVCSFHFVDGKPTEEHPYPEKWLGHDVPVKKPRRALKRLSQDVMVSNVEKKDEESHITSPRDVESPWEHPAVCEHSYASRSSSHPQPLISADGKHGSRIIYNAMPAVGADGQTIMKLFPVQTIKENFDLTQGSHHKQNPALKTTGAVNFTKPAPAQADPSVTQFVRMQVSLGNVLPNKIDQKSHSPKKPQIQKVPQIETPAAHHETSETPPVWHSATEKPSDKQTQRVTVSHLPPSDNRLGTQSCSPSPGVYISPIDPMNVDTLPKSTSAPLCRKFPPSKTPFLGPKPSLKLIPCSPQSPNGPIRWMVEDDNSVNPALPGYGVAAEILRTVAERERAHKKPEALDKSISLSSQNYTVHKEDDALILCNGKVFKKHSPPLQVRETDSSTTTTTKSYIFTKTTSPLESSHTWHVRKLIIPRRSHEVRDFCEDAPDERCQKAASAVTSPDEDDVIFVSYTPLTANAAPTEDLTLETQTAVVSGGVQTQKESTVAMPSGGVRIHCKQHSNTQQAACTKHSIDTVTSEGMHSAIDMESWIEQSFGGPAESSWLKPAPHHISDHLLRRIFGITADVKICLQRIDEASVGSLAKHRYSESIQTDVQHQEPISKVHEEELFLSELHSPPDSHSGSISVKSEEELSVDSLTSHTFTRPLKCSHMEAKRKLKNYSGQSDAATEALFGYMEPIDGDFLSMDEEHKQDVTDRTQEKRKRIGRTRKRTICPCCVSGAQNQALKLSLKTVFPGKKSGAKTARKRVKPSGKIRCPTAKKRSSLLCSSSGDSDEVKCREEIKQLRELLREKEEALELLRRNTNT